MIKGILNAADPMETAKKCAEMYGKTDSAFYGSLTGYFVQRATESQGAGEAAVRVLESEGVDELKYLVDHLEEGGMVKMAPRNCEEVYRSG